MILLLPVETLSIVIVVLLPIGLLAATIKGKIKESADDSARTNFLAIFVVCFIVGFYDGFLAQGPVAFSSLH
ncbi:conserved exported hypothetical protein [Klebsiella variicola]|nr:conserved exported hypothetical protein [Klebsiella variicola]